jgi:hypothetical protein
MLFLIPPLIQTDTHRRNQRQIHPLRYRNHIRLLARKQLTRVQQLAIDPRDRLPGLRVCDVGVGIEEIALHYQFLLLVREGVDESTDRFGGANYLGRNLSTSKNREKTGNGCH